MKRFCKNSLKALFILILLVVMNATPIFAQATYTWNKTGTADWTTAANWTPVRTTPAADDILLFNGGNATTLINIPSQTIAQVVINNNTTVHLQAAAAGNILNIAGLATGDDLTISSGSSLSIDGANATTLYVASGATANITGNITFSAADHRLDAADAGGIVFNSPAIFTQDAGCSGNVFTATGTNNAIVFNTGSAFIQKAGANPFALTQPHSKVVFNKGSLFKVQQSLFLSFSGRTYPRLEIDYTGFNQSAVGVNALNVEGLTITKGTLSLNLTGGIYIQGDIDVAANGVLNFNTATTGTINFNGSTLQQITNAGTLYFNNNEVITFNNSAGFKINNDITFNNVVNFTSGIINIPDPAILTLGAAATVANVSNNSFADGMVKKIGNTAFTFPVGNAGIGYVPVSISAPGVISDAFTAAYKRAAATALSSNYAAGLDHVSGVDYWIVNRASGTSPVDVTLYWTSQSSSNGSALYINNISKLVIAHYDGNTQWNTYGGSYNAGSGFAAGSVTWTGVNNFSSFSLASTDVTNPLPVKLEYFNGSKQDNKNSLTWKLTCSTSATVNLERSTDAGNFTSINKTTANALSCLQPFNYTDAYPLPGLNYYRLRITESDGNVTYSATVVFQNKKSSVEMLHLVPNIVTSNATIHIIADQKTSLEMVVTDVTGRQVQKITYDLIAGTNQLTLHLSGLGTGIYQICGYTKEGTTKPIRFIKQ